MKIDRRRHRFRGLLARLTWYWRGDRYSWTEVDDADYELEVAEWKWRTP